MCLRIGLQCGDMGGDGNLGRGTLRGVFRSLVLSIDGLSGCHDKNDLWKEMFVLLHTLRVSFILAVQLEGRGIRQHGPTARKWGELNAGAQNSLLFIQARLHPMLTLRVDASSSDNPFG